MTQAIYRFTRPHELPVTISVGTPTVLSAGLTAHPQYPQATVGTVLRNRPRLPTIKRFQIHRKWPSCHKIQLQILATVNRWPAWLVWPPGVSPIANHAGGTESPTLGNHTVTQQQHSHPTGHKLPTPYTSWPTSTMKMEAMCSVETLISLQDQMASFIHWRL
jgi:hypothetical protein